jgi:cell fate regulator YaaT (PSP1 superfamily)
MAKMQKATLDPSKISGFCGRLKCCLRYEDKTYTELKQLLPGKGTVVKTPHGQGKVVDTQIMAQLVMVEREDGTRVAVHRDELEVISAPAISAESQDRQQEGQIQDGEEEQREQQEQ